MWKISLITLFNILLLVAGLATVVLQNQASWEVRFLWLNGEVPGIISIFLIAGITVAILVKRGAKPQH